MAAAAASSVLADRPPPSGVLADRPPDGVLADGPPDGVLADRPPGPRVPLTETVAVSHRHATYDEWTLDTSPPATVMAVVPPSKVGAMTMAAANLFFLASSPSGLGSTGHQLNGGWVPVAPADSTASATPSTRGCTRRTPKWSNPWAADHQRRVVAGDRSAPYGAVTIGGRATDTPPLVAKGPVLSKSVVEPIEMPSASICCATSRPTHSPTGYRPISIV